MTIDKLMETLPDNYNAVDRELIQRAYQFALKAHSGQQRVSGESFITHCVSVGIILAELNVPPALVASGLLHDTVEDTAVTLDDIRREFGEDIARLVDGVTKLTQLPRVQRGDHHLTEDDENGSDAIPLIPISDASRKRQLAQETLRKTFLAMGEDIRVVLVKLADRLHNMRTLYVLSESKQKRIAQETLDIFAPLANRLGIWQMKWELEDQGFRYVNPEKYSEIASFNFFSQGRSRKPGPGNHNPAEGNS